jgi:hypothetical protein
MMFFCWVTLVVSKVIFFFFFFFFFWGGGIPQCPSYYASHQPLVLKINKYIIFFQPMCVFQCPLSLNPTPYTS